MQKTILVGDVILNVRFAGPRDGPLLILLHGFPEFSYGWNKVMEPLARAGYFVAAPDQRGYGWSEKPRPVGAYRIDRLARDIEGLIRVLGRKKAYVAGHDWGGAVAWWLALTKPELIEKLVILNVAHPYVFQRHLRKSLSQQIKSFYMLAFQSPLLPEWWLRRQGFKRAKKVLQSTSRKGAFSEQDLSEYEKAWSQPGALRGMLNWYRAAFRRKPARPKLKTVAVPTLLIWGKKDPFLGSEMAAPSLELCKEGRLEFIDEATHWVVHEEPEKVVKLMTEFCR